MQHFYRRYYKTVFDIGLLLLTVYLFMLAFSYLYKIATPIFLSFIIYAINEPLARFLHKKGMKKSIATTISTLIFVTIILSLMVGAGAIFVKESIHLQDSIKGYTAQIQSEIQRNTGRWQQLFSALPPNVVQKVKDYTTILIADAEQIALTFLTYLVVNIKSFSTFLIQFFIGIILAYFLSLEIEVWKKFANEKIPRTFKHAFHFLKEHVFIGLVSYVKAQLKLISLTFLVIFISLLILGISNSFSISLLSAFFDLLPLLGVSTVFIPWIIYLFILGNTQLAIWLSVILGIVILVRQFMEPKITGDSLGVSAFTILSFMVISLSIFGVAGVIISPILIILIKALYDQGYLNRWIRLPEDEFD